MKKLWGGRFSKRTDALVERYTSSIAVDFRLAKHDVVGSIAHAKMLGACRIIAPAESRRLVAGLERLLAKIEKGELKPDASAEDVHTQIEVTLEQLVGPVAGKLHTARSRNDQVALDLRLYCREAIGRIQSELRDLQRSLVEQGRANADVVIPGYTHLQRAQPILLAHHLLAYVEMLERDRERLHDTLKRVLVLPLGAGALAGTSLPTDRRIVAKLLGFPRIAQNSLDAVSDRDFAIELVADCALIGMHLSRLAEDLILWTTEEFGIVELDESDATGSSLMPQKKNPDVLELARGQAGLVVGELVALLVVLKGLPLAYNRDLQWDKRSVFAAVDAMDAALPVLAGVIGRLRIRRDRIAGLLASDALCATDLAEHLVKQGVPFRRAHEMIGKLVLAAERSGVKLADAPLAEQPELAPYLGKNGKDLGPLTDARRSVQRKQSLGGTGTRQVKAALASWHAKLTK